MFTVFANMLINSDERFEHLKDSFESFKNTSDDWLINIRGKKRDEVMNFLRERLGNKATFFDLTDDSRGWIENALEMLPNAKREYVLLWNEDHVNVAGEEYLNKVAAEVREHAVDFLLHTWWQSGSYIQQFEHLSLQKGQTIDSVLLTPDVWRKVLEQGHTPYLVSAAGIFSKNFLKRLFLHDRYKLPLAFTPWVYRMMTLVSRILRIKFNQRAWFHWINGLIGHRLRRFPKETPFDLEKAHDRFDILPFKIGLTKKELFACVDDEDDPKHPYSLARRGLYPVRDLLQRENSLPAEAAIPEKVTLGAGAAIREAYLFLDRHKHTRVSISREYVRAAEGRVQVKVRDQILELEKGELASFFTNIPFEITALTSSIVERSRPETGLAPHYIST